MTLFELHGSDAEMLRENFRTAGREVRIAAEDGFIGLKSCLPPPTRRRCLQNSRTRRTG